jgi:cytoskeletal protein RodZ
MSNGQQGDSKTQQPLKTDQQILEELRQASGQGGGEKRRSVGLTAFVVLLAIVIAVFTAVNNNKKDDTANESNNAPVNQTSETNDETTPDETDDTTDTTDDESDDAQDAADAAQEAAETIGADGTVNGEAVGETPNAQSTHTDTEYSENAQVGEGVTHLARRALHGYLADKGIADLSREHRVYLEDYLTKHSNPVGLEIGEGRTFGTGLMEEALTNARALTTAELQNLSQFASMVPGL